MSAYAGIPLRGMARLRRAVFISFLPRGRKETRGGRASPAEESDFIGISSDASSRGGLHSICYADRLFPRLKENSFDKIG